jgi:hypothetical protein
MDVFNDLGDRIARAWSRHRYGTDALPGIAANELERQPLHRVLHYKDILNWVACTNTLPYQMNVEATFGEPPVTTFWHPDFYIEVLFWCTSTTAIHGHGFVGAFQVLTGTSLQSLFEFEPQPPKRDLCRIGRLRQTAATLLRPGATQEILGAEQFIHSVFHLGYPSVTIVVRTHSRAVGVQYLYYRPGVALANGYEATFDQLTSRLLQIARLQATMQSDDLRTTVARIGHTCELAASFKLLETIQPILYAQNRGEAAAEVVATLVASAGYRAAKLAQALTLDQNLRHLSSARSVIVDDELRLFLALLLTRQPRPFVVSTVEDYTGVAGASHKVAAWIRELGRQAVLNVPADETTESLMKVWLDNGEKAALQFAGANRNSNNMEEVVSRVKAEPLLAPLVRDDFFGR